MIGIWFGIDVSKKKLHAAYWLGGQKYRMITVDNTASGFAKLLVWAMAVADGKAMGFCMEATGDYGLAAGLYLTEAGHHVSVINPAWIKHFGMGKGRLNKTDKADSKLICDYARDGQPEAWHLADPRKRQLFRLHRRRIQLTEHIVAEMNRRECPEAIGADCMASIKRVLKALRTERRDIDKQISEILKTPGFAGDLELLLSLPRFGLSSVLVALAEMPNVEHCDSAKAYAAAAGGNPTAKESGTSVSSSSMSRGGRRIARSVLWMPTLNLIRLMPELDDLYNRLRKKGQKHKQALIACIRKLLMIIYGMLTTRTPYKPKVFQAAA